MNSSIKNKKLIRIKKRLEQKYHDDKNSKNLSASSSLLHLLIHYVLRYVFLSQVMKAATRKNIYILYATTLCTPLSNFRG